MILTMNKYIKTALLFALPAAALSSCNDYLDTMPDNRTTLDSEFKIEKMLTSAYPDHEYCTALEMISDNTDDYGERVTSENRWFDDTFNWKDEIETDNSSFKNVWEGCYTAIAATNEVFQAIDALEQTEKIRQLRGEALLCRAYNHFMLGAIFCKAWTQNAANDLGLPYMEKAETELDPKYERGNLADFYNKIQADLEEGLQYVSDAYYTVPKYHFNVKAAWAFATRFYIFTEQWDKAIQAANRCLGSSPASALRDWTSMAAMTQSYDAVSDAYIDAASPANLLLGTGYSSLGLIYGPYTYCGRYNHGISIATNEDIRANNIFGDYTMFRITPKTYQGSSYNKVIFWKAAYKFEYTDLVAQIGYAHTVVPLFTSDECLLNRAEAYIMTNRFDEAAADLTLWMKNITKSTKTLTPDNIVAFYKDKPYSYEDAKGLQGTLKKHLNPAFAIDAEGSTQECMLQCMLGFRRMETLHHGLRWFDIKRYGIEIPRRLMNANNQPEELKDVLKKDDKRRAVQIPQDVRDAGLEPNPRDTAE